MPDLPYSIPVTVIEPGDGDKATRAMGRITAGTAYARTQGFSDVTIFLDATDYKLYVQANQLSETIAPLTAMSCDGAGVERLDGPGASRFRVTAKSGEILTFPLMTDGEYITALNLTPGMFVVRAGDLTPRELVADPLNRGILRIGMHRYDRKGRAQKRNAPAILYAWDTEAMEAKAAAGELTDMEKTFFSSILSTEIQSATLESQTAVKQ